MRYQRPGDEGRRPPHSPAGHLRMNSCPPQLSCVGDRAPSPVCLPFSHLFRTRWSSPSCVLPHAFPISPLAPSHSSAPPGRPRTRPTFPTHDLDRIHPPVLHPSLLPYSQPSLIGQMCHMRGRAWALSNHPGWT